MGSVAQEILNRSLRHKLGLTRYEAEIVRRMIALLNASDAELLLRIQDAYDRSLSLETQERYKAIQRELRSVNIEAYRRVREVLTEELRNAAAENGRFYADMIEDILPFKFSMTRPSPQLLKALVITNPFQGALLADHIEKLAGNRIGLLTDQIQRGVLQGDSLSQLVKRVRGTRKNGYKDGILQGPRRQLEAVVRTATMHYTETARDILFEENRDLIRGTMWVATFDHLTCPRCQPRDGLVWDWNATLGAYVPVSHGFAWEGGPGRIHYQCRCTGIPVLRDVDDLITAGIDVGKLGADERAAYLKPVPLKTTFEEWLSTQPEEIQIASLGSRKRARIFREEGDLEEAWKRGFVPRAVIPAGSTEIFAN